MMHGQTQIMNFLTLCNSFIEILATIHGYWQEKHPYSVCRTMNSIRIVHENI